MAVTEFEEIWGAILRGDGAAAQDALDALEEDGLEPAGRAEFAAATAYLAALEGDDAELASILTRAEMDGLRSCTLTMMTALYRLSRRDEEGALRLLHQGAKTAEGLRSPWARATLGTLFGSLALIHLTEGDDDRGALYLEMAAELDAPGDQPAKARARALFKGLDLDTPTAPKPKGGGGAPRKRRR